MSEKAKSYPCITEAMQVFPTTFSSTITWIAPNMTSGFRNIEEPIALATLDSYEPTNENEITPPGSKAD